MESVIELKGIRKSYREEVVLQELTHCFAAAKIHGIIGKNGSGKTTLLKLICGYAKPTAGEVYVFNERVGKDVDFPQNMGVIIETPGFIPYYSGLNNLMTIGSIRHTKKEDIVRALRLVGLDPDSRKHVRKYSMGMNQRLGIAQAIMEDPELLILDEPFNGLDSQGVEDMRQLLLSLKEKGKTILITSHYTQDIEALCDTVHEMDAGVIKSIL
jgi:ABC-2 type transport system ATP-binding protein